MTPSNVIGFSSFVEVTRTFITSQMSSNFSQIRYMTAELAALECLKKSIFSVVGTLAPSILNESSSFLNNKDNNNILDEFNFS